MEAKPLRATSVGLLRALGSPPANAFRSGQNALSDDPVVAVVRTARNLGGRWCPEGRAAAIGWVQVQSSGSKSRVWVQKIAKKELGS